MHKTLHKKLTEKHLYAYMPLPAYTDGSNNRTRALQEKNLLHQIATDLLHPRPEAIALILKMSRSL